MGKAFVDGLRLALNLAGNHAQAPFQKTPVLIIRRLARSPMLVADPLWHR